MSRFFALIVAALTVVACASALPPANPRTLYAAWESDFQRAVASNPLIDPIRGRVPLVKGPSEITFSMLADTSSATDDQRTAIRQFADVWQPFRERLQLLDQQFTPLFARVNEAERMAVSALLADLYNRSITFGDYAKKRQEIRVTADQARQQIRSTAAANAAVAEQAAKAAAAEQAAIARFDSYLITQQALRRQQQQNIRLQTTCSQVGTFLYCN